MDLVNKKKNSERPNKIFDSEDLEAAGSEGSKIPLLECGDDETDPDLLSQLNMKAKTKPNDGSNASSWDSTWD